LLRANHTLQKLTIFSQNLSKSCKGLDNYDIIHQNRETNKNLRLKKVGMQDYLDYAEKIFG
jgi:hypothetical protein